MNEYDFPNYESRCIASFLVKRFAEKFKNNPSVDSFLDLITFNHYNFPGDTFYINGWLHVKLHNFSAPVIAEVKICTVCTSEAIGDQAFYTSHNPQNKVIVKHDENLKKAIADNLNIKNKKDTKYLLTQQERWDPADGRLRDLHL